MKKIVITCFCMPNELDDLERVLVDLNKASKYIDGSNYEFYVSVSVDDYLIQWDLSSVKKEFVVEKFSSLKPLTDWASKSTFQIRPQILGALSNKVYAHNEVKDATHFIWLDTDICFDEKILVHMENSIDAIESNKITDKYFITPEVVKYWDTTWDCIVNKNFLDKPLDYCKINNPFQDCGEHGEVGLENVQNNVPGQPKTKFGAGWFTCLSKKLLDRIPVPSSMGHYGPDDTYLMWAIDKINSLEDNSIYQFKLTNYVVCENFKYRNRNYYNNVIKRIDRKEEFKKIAQENLVSEIKNLS